MITLIASGVYKIFETKRHTRLLVLDDSKSYAWIMAGDIGEILVASQKTHQPDHILVIGRYRLYNVADEPNFVDLEHLELSVGRGKWQGYLLPTGLPNARNKRNRIIASQEIISIRRNLLERKSATK